VPEEPRGVVGDLHPLAVLAPHDQIGQERAGSPAHRWQRRVELPELVLSTQRAGKIERQQPLVQACVDVLAPPLA
jgi:hypothetical protein